MELALDLNPLSLIGFADGAEGDPFTGINPATGSPLEPSFYTASAQDLDRAASLAQAAFLIYGNLSGKARAAFLRQIAGSIEAAAPAIIHRANLETALPEGRLQGELARTCNQLRVFAQLIEEGSWVDARIDNANPDRKPLPKPDIRSMHKPLGPVAVFGASNFPPGLLGGWRRHRLRPRRRLSGHRQSPSRASWNQRPGRPCHPRKRQSLWPARRRLFHAL